MKGIKSRLTIMNFLEFAVWGSYLTSMGGFLANVGLQEYIGWFYAVQGIVSLFMPALIGIVADRFMNAQKVLSLCHLLAALSMIGVGAYAFSAENNVSFPIIFSIYTFSVAFFMPTIGLSNSVAYTALNQANLDTIKHFPPIRIFGTIGFICAMLFVDFLGFQHNAAQFYTSAIIGFILSIYALSLPNCPISKTPKSNSFIDTFGLRAFALFKQKKMAIFFIFSMLLGVSLQITNGFANPFITAFRSVAEYADTFGAKHANALISLSQVSETLCILLIPFFLKRYGIKIVMLISMLAWFLRFGLFGLGNPGEGVWMFILSMIVYGVAFDFFNVSGSLYVDKETDSSIRSSAQGLFMIMTNGIGATIGTLGAQAVINHFVFSQSNINSQLEGWSTSWLIFAGYALVVAILFALIFRYKHQPEKL